MTKEERIRRCCDMLAAVRREEREAILAWLRDPKNDCAGFEWIAHAIDRGEYRSGEPLPGARRRAPNAVEEAPNVSSQRNDSAALGATCLHIDRRCPSWQACAERTAKHSAWRVTDAMEQYAELIALRKVAEAARELVNSHITPPGTKGNQWQALYEALRELEWLGSTPSSGTPREGT